MSFGSKVSLLKVIVFLCFLFVGYAVYYLPTCVCVVLMISVWV